jgi:hypothetical protein
MHPKADLLCPALGFGGHDPQETFGFRSGALWDFGLAAMDFATSRAQSMKRSTTGLKVRFFSVTIVTGHGRAGRSTANTNPLIG